ncbi:MAG: flagellar assembly protein FliW [bacterium]|jgi:flagellar assembly factor FliW
MQFQTARFGEITIAPEDIFDFPFGLIGFPEYRRYAIYREEKLAPFMWLQSLEEPRLCFFVVEPFLFFPDYEVNVKLDRVMESEFASVSDLLVLGIVNIAPEFTDSTVNLLGPLVLNKIRRVGYQFVMDDSPYETKHRLFAAAAESGRAPDLSLVPEAKRA